MQSARIVSIFQVIFSFPRLISIILESSTFKNSKILSQMETELLNRYASKINQPEVKSQVKKKIKAFHLRSCLWILSPYNYVGLINTLSTGHKKIHNVLTKANSHTDPQVSLTKYTSGGTKICLGILSGSRFSQIYWTIWHS